MPTPNTLINAIQPEQKGIHNYTKLSYLQKYYYTYVNKNKQLNIYKKSKSYIV